MKTYKFLEKRLNDKLLEKKIKGEKEKKHFLYHLNIKTYKFLEKKLKERRKKIFCSM